MEYVVQVPIDAPAVRVWQVLADLRSWPAWTPTVESVDTDHGRPRLGGTVILTQPGRSPARYTVTAVEDGHRFRWGSDRRGIRQSADHVVEPTGDSTCSVTLSFAMCGAVGRPLGVLAGARIRRMVDTEAAALRAAVTSRAG